MIARRLAWSTVMLAARRAGLVGQLPPERITEAALDAAGQRRSKEVQDALAVILHLLFGAQGLEIISIPLRAA